MSPSSLGSWKGLTSGPPTTHFPSRALHTFQLFFHLLWAAEEAGGVLQGKEHQADADSLATRWAAPGGTFRAGPPPPSPPTTGGQAECVMGPVLAHEWWESHESVTGVRNLHPKLCRTSREGHVIPSGVCCFLSGLPSLPRLRWLVPPSPLPPSPTLNSKL